MSIRNVKKDHLKELAQPVSAVPVVVVEPVPTSDDPLRFWTKHSKKPCLVDLTPLKDGQMHLPNGRWGGPYSGRPALIEQLAPALRDLTVTASTQTVGQVMTSLRNWWRLFDDMERRAADAGNALPVVTTVADIADLQRQVAFESGMTRAAFGPFVRAVDVTRRALGLRPLHWTGPDEPDVRRHLPPFAKIKPIRDALKRHWYAALDRWERADQLLAGASPKSEGEALQLANYQRLREAAKATGKAWPGANELYMGRSASFFYKQGYRHETMLQCAFPDAADIRAAFHLCLVTTGWNPATFLSLNVNEPFLEAHPKDESRYLLTGFKERSKSHQVTEGLFKCQRSAGVILQTLMRRTEPLRAQLRAEHRSLQAEFEELQAAGAPQVALDKKRKAIIDLEQGLRSPWLFVTPEQGITWLAGGTFQRLGTQGYLDQLIAGINAKRAPHDQVPKLTATDFRDAFAAFAYQQSGGMVLYVMRVLGHKRLSSTQRYLDNTLLNDESARIFRTFNNSLWSEIKLHGRLDATVVAKWCRDGQVTDEERKRLEDYRTLKRSRLGIGCKSPTTPPRSVAPGFKADGKALCSTQRCTLCLENAVILPESLPGLTMRKAELLHLQSSMPAMAFSDTSFDEELHNTELALLAFDATEVSSLVTGWQQRIASGQHRVIHLEVIEESRA
ncbi:site-specific integrase [Piscinibacter defluvii]|uniref:site-specific integrase n=1 Tax=Piscinibacter defluvii TaxID=1796922 RepID=UPI000FDCE4B4|nr:site-specific integrase [Piscinibacter defluvii]